MWQSVDVFSFILTTALGHAGAAHCVVENFPSPPAHEIIVSGQYAGQDFAFTVSTDGKSMTEPQGPPAPAICAATS